MLTLTIDGLEALASQLDSEDDGTRAAQLRTIRAAARILHHRAPGTFTRGATWTGDEPGHSDNSYPPRQVRMDRTGPAVVRVVRYTTTDVPTSGGYYYTWRRSTTDGGCYVGRDGTLWCADESGTGRVGRFAAHPGDCDVDCDVVWSQLDPGEVSTATLALAARVLLALVREHALVGPSDGLPA